MHVDVKKKQKTKKTPRLCELARMFVNTMYFIR